ncbi:uncharacterized protein B0H64DRAFT_368398 [Chaetomium fimeti]|uniref:FAD-binding domain-containing protein n=1 Tax=Chaetomium fimeti TaxID=1854472 RepID=A0AAE0LMS2_9PEZI|nr:hypothetical protein B0H64DRAFT_368398 [Chaetomium fimeti]
MSPTGSKDPLHIAIIGGGITGVNLALGLQARNVSYSIYERSAGFREIGAGIGFSPNAERAMAALNPDILTSYKRLANPNGEDYFQWVNGCATDEPIFKLHVGKDGFQGGLRSKFLEEWAKLIPPTAVQFSKQLDTITEPTPDSPKLRLHFTDGTTATADAVIGCDGIHSRVRDLLLAPQTTTNPPAPGDQPPSSPPTTAHPTYTHKFCFRTLAPMPAAIAAIGPTQASTRFMYNGPGAHLITYPVGNSTLLNILAVIDATSSTPWPYGQRHTAPGHRSEAERAFEQWGPTARAIVGLFPDSEEGAPLDKWALFDMAEYPMPGYARGRVGVAGDAAHAAGPHLGAGAGMGVEDAAVLAAVLGAIGGWWEGDGEGEGHELLERALRVFNEVRYSRTQWVVHAAREACDLFQWRDEAIGKDPERFGREITELFHTIWKYDVDGMVEEALAKLGAPAS